MILLDITPLKVSRDYRLLFFGQLVSYFGSMMTFVVAPWQMYTLTGSNAMVGYIYLAEFVPMVLVAFIGGAMADYVDRRRLLRWSEIGQALVTGILLGNALLPQPQIWVIFLAVALHAGFASLQRPAFESLIQKVVSADLMPAVMALNAIRSTSGAIIAPALAGVIASQISVAVAYAIDLLTFIATLIAVYLIKAAPASENAERPSWQSIKRGWSYAFGRQELTGTYAIDLVAMFFAMPQALYPALAALYYGDEYVGFFPAALAAGALLASITSGWTKDVHRHGVMVVGAALLWGVGIALFGWAQNLWLALGFLAFAGFFDMISGIFRGAIWNQTIPNFLRGRLASIEMVSYLAGPMLGNAKMGLVAEHYGVRTAIVSGGILCIGAVGLVALLLPKFMRYDGRAGITQRELEEQIEEREAGLR